MQQQASLRYFSLTLFLLVLSAAISCGKSSSLTPGAPGGAGSGPSTYQPVTPHTELRGESNLATLIREHAQGQARNQPWAGYWFPYAENGISLAAAKYEQAHGPTGATDWEVRNHGSGLSGLQSWWGHCNGWSAAAALFGEPREARDVGGTHFEVADQKALLSEVGMEVNADFFGWREDDPGDFSSPTFQDIYPDQFFLVLLNQTGKGLPLVMDRYTGYQVWNQPIAGYQVSPIRPEDDLGADPSAPQVHRVMVTTQVWWARDDVDAGHLTEPFAFQDSASYDSRVLRFELWLDGPPRFDGAGTLKSSGNVILARQGQYVIGGAWRNGEMDPADSHPDYLWVPHSLTAPTGYANPGVDAGWLNARLRS